MIKLLKNINTVHKLQVTTIIQLSHKTNSTIRHSHSSRCPNLTPIRKTQTYFLTIKQTICGTCGRRSSLTGTTTKIKWGTRGITRKKPTVSLSSRISMEPQIRGRMSSQISIKKTYRMGVMVMKQIKDL
jgi:hypothetical protein